MHIAITGSSGLVGPKLIPLLEAAGHTVTRVTRPGSASAPGAITWDPAAGTIDAAALEGVDAVINLNGRSIGERRWNAVIRTSCRMSATETFRSMPAGTTLRTRPESRLA